MTYKEINNVIKSIGISSNYYEWPDGSAPALPYILFYYPERNDFIADGKNYSKIVRLNVELYTKNKDFVLEETVENVFELNDLVYDKEEQYINDEHMYEVLYVMDVLITN